MQKEKGLFTIKFAVSAATKVNSPAIPHIKLVFLYEKAIVINYNFELNPTQKFLMYSHTFSRNLLSYSWKSWSVSSITI